MSEHSEGMTRCQDERACRWRVERRADMYGVRTEMRRCETCGRSRMVTGLAPTLGERHYRSD